MKQNHHIVLVVLFAFVILGAIAFHDAEAAKSQGNSLTETNSKKICGVTFCDEKLSNAEKIKKYYYKVEETKLRPGGVSQQQSQPTFTEIKPDDKVHLLGICTTDNHTTIVLIDAHTGEMHSRGLYADGYSTSTEAPPLQDAGNSFSDGDTHTPADSSSDSVSASDNPSSNTADDSSTDSSGSGLLIFNGPGIVQNDGGIKNKNCLFIYIDEEEYNSAVAYINDYPRTYRFLSQNCVDFAEDVFEETGIAVPEPIFSFYFFSDPEISDYTSYNGISDPETLNSALEDFSGWSRDADGTLTGRGSDSGPTILDGALIGDGADLAPIIQDHLNQFGDEHRGDRLTDDKPWETILEDQRIEQEDNRQSQNTIVEQTDTRVAFGLESALNGFEAAMAGGVITNVDVAPHGDGLKFDYGANSTTAVAVLDLPYSLIDSPDGMFTVSNGDQTSTIEATLDYDIWSLSIPVSYYDESFQVYGTMLPDLFSPLIDVSGGILDDSFDELTISDDAGNLFTYHEDGSTTGLYKDGSVFTFFADGSARGVDPDGAKIFQSVDGILYYEWLDGATGVKHPDGNWVKTHADGTTDTGFDPDYSRTGETGTELRETGDDTSIFHGSNIEDRTELRETGDDTSIFVEGPDVTTIGDLETGSGGGTIIDDGKDVGDATFGGTDIVAAPTAKHPCEEILEKQGLMPYFDDAVSRIESDPYDHDPDGPKGEEVSLESGSYSSGSGTISYSDGEGAPLLVDFKDGKITGMGSGQDTWVTVDHCDMERTQQVQEMRDLIAGMPDYDDPLPGLVDGWEPPTYFDGMKSLFEGANGCYYQDADGYIWLDVNCDGVVDDEDTIILLADDDPPKKIGLFPGTGDSGDIIDYGGEQIDVNEAAGLDEQEMNPDDFLNILENALREAESPSTGQSNEEQPITNEEFKELVNEGLENSMSDVNLEPTSFDSMQFLADGSNGSYYEDGDGNVWLDVDGDGVVDDGDKIILTTDPDSDEKFRINLGTGDAGDTIEYDGTTIDVGESLGTDGQQSTSESSDDSSSKVSMSFNPFVPPFGDDPSQIRTINPQERWSHYFLKDGSEWKYYTTYGEQFWVPYKLNPDEYRLYFTENIYDKIMQMDRSIPANISVLFDPVTGLATIHDDILDLEFGSKGSPNGGTTGPTMTREDNTADDTKDGVGGPGGDGVKVSDASGSDGTTGPTMTREPGGTTGGTLVDSPDNGTSPGDTSPYRIFGEDIEDENVWFAGVFVGDLEGFPNFAAHLAADEAESDFEKAGYKVIRRDKATRDHMILFATHERARAFWFVGHAFTVQEKGLLFEKDKVYAGISDTTERGFYVTPDKSSLPSSEGKNKSKQIFGQDFNLVHLQSCYQHQYRDKWLTAFPGAAFISHPTGADPIDVVLSQFLAVYEPIDPETGEVINKKSAYFGSASDLTTGGELVLGQDILLDSTSDVSTIIQDLGQSSNGLCGAHCTAGSCPISANNESGSTVGDGITTTFEQGRLTIEFSDGTLTGNLDLTDNGNLVFQPMTKEPDLDSKDSKTIGTTGPTMTREKDSSDEKLEEKIPDDKDASGTTGPTMTKDSGDSTQTDTGDNTDSPFTPITYGTPNGSDLVYCGPDFTEQFLIALKNIWTRAQNITDEDKGWGIDSTWFMLANGNMMDLEGPSIATDDIGILIDGCPTHMCKFGNTSFLETKEICGTCVMNHTTNDMLFGMMASIVETPVLEAYVGAQILDSITNRSLSLESDSSRASYRLGYVMDHLFDKFTPEEMNEALFCSTITALDDWTILTSDTRLQGCTLQPDHCVVPYATGFHQSNWNLEDGILDTSGNFIETDSSATGTHPYSTTVDSEGNVVPIDPDSYLENSKTDETTGTTTKEKDSPNDKLEEKIPDKIDDDTDAKVSEKNPDVDTESAPTIVGDDEIEWELIDPTELDPDALPGLEDDAWVPPTSFDGMTFLIDGSNGCYYKDSEGNIWLDVDCDGIVDDVDNILLEIDKDSDEKPTIHIGTDDSGDSIEYDGVKIDVNELVETDVDTETTTKIRVVDPDSGLENVPEETYDLEVIEWDIDDETIMPDSPDSIEPEYEDNTQPDPYSDSDELDLQPDTFIPSAPISVEEDDGLIATKTEPALQTQTLVASLNEYTKPSYPVSALSQSVTVSLIPGSAVAGCETTKTCYTPYSVSISQGDTILWNNDDDSPHTVTSGIATEGPDGIFDSDLLVAKSSYSKTFDTVGEFPYFCVVHPWMQGVVNVSELIVPDPFKRDIQGAALFDKSGKPLLLNQNVQTQYDMKQEKWMVTVSKPNSNEKMSVYVEPKSANDVAKELFLDDYNVITKQDVASKLSIIPNILEDIFLKQWSDDKKYTPVPAKEITQSSENTISKLLEIFQRFQLT